MLQIVLSILLPILVLGFSKECERLKKDITVCNDDCSSKLYPCLADCSGPDDTDCINDCSTPVYSCINDKCGAESKKYMKNCISEKCKEATQEYMMCMGPCSWKLIECITGCNGHSDSICIDNCNNDVKICAENQCSSYQKKVQESCNNSLLENIFSHYSGYGMFLI